MQYDIIIIGAGAAGLMAASKLSKNGYNICVIEADSKPGGRIQSIMHRGITLETGAEFIHGHSPVTDELLKEIGLEKQKVTGEMIPVHNGVWFGRNVLAENSKLLSDKLESIESDMTIEQFLNMHFPEHEYDELRKSVIQFSEGFSLADIQKASVYALKREWSQIEEDQFRVPGGYGVIVDHLFSQCKQAEVPFFFDTKVHEVENANGKVIVRTDSKEFTSRIAIITCSVGVLQSNEFKLLPANDQVNTAVTQLAIGSVIKILFLFKDPFWQAHHDDVGFILSDEDVPTWWTQGDDSRLLTGWVGGTKAREYSKGSEEIVLQTAIRSLAHIFKMKESEIRALMEFHKVIIWDKKPFIRGGYSYVSVFTEEGRKTLEQPVGGMIYFAGEATYSGELAGTVEAALASGISVAEKIQSVKRENLVV